MLQMNLYILVGYMRRDVLVFYDAKVLKNISDSKHFGIWESSRNFI